MIFEMATPLLENNGSTIIKPLPKPYGKIVLTLTNCLLPEEKLSPTPSQLDGLDQNTETDLRILGCELIQTAGILLKLPQVAMATGQVLFQRFYYSKSFVRHPMETTAMGCVCLASKIEEAPRRIRDVINVFNHIKQVTAGNLNYWGGFVVFHGIVSGRCDNGGGRLTQGCMCACRTIAPVVLDNNYIHLKTQVIKAERRVLKELGFCVHVKHPHKIIVIYLQLLGFENNTSLMQLSWNYMNDALRTNVFVRYHPETVACACIYLTARRLKICMPKNPAWYSIFGVSEKDIHDVCYSILRLYKRHKVNPEELERTVEELRKEFQETKMKARAAAGLALISANNTPANVSNSPNSPVQQRQKPEVSPRMKNNHSNEKHHSKEDKRRSQTNSVSPMHRHRNKSKKHKRSSSSRSRSRSRSRDRRKKSSHKSRVRSSYSDSPPPSPPSHKLSHKSSKSREKSRYRSRSRSHDRDRERSRGDRSRSRSYERYSSSGSKYHEKSKSSKHSRLEGHKRSKEIRR
ncbi:hypothetical protein B566_EDAN008249 [Ephemera danica]|nr:hypothetical protein B566_EDAN008249 [Ephemera danica]